MENKGAETTVSRDDGESLVTDVVVHVADVVGSDPLDLPPLRDVINPDGLTRLFCPFSEETPGYDAHVAFTYAGCDVAVYSDGTIVAHPRESTMDGAVR
jgi:hypothetical protein